MKQHSFLLRALAIAGVLAIVAAACQGDEGGGGDGEQVDCGTFGCVEVASGAPIKVGTLLSVSGPTANLGTDSLQGVELAIDYLDGSFDQTDGQILGHDVQLVNEDDGCSAEGGQAGATALAADTDVFAVIGTTCSSAALGVADTILGDVGTLLFSPSNTNPGLTSEEAHVDYYARTAHNDKIQGAIGADFVFNELGIDTAATIHDESPYAEGLAAAFRDRFEALGGTITAIEQIQSTETDFKPLLESIAQGDPGMLYYPDFNPACTLITQQAKEIMPDTALMGADGCMETALLEAAGKDADGMYASGPDLTVFQAGEFYNSEFLPAYNAAAGTEPTAVFHAHAYDAFMVLADAIEAAAVDNGDGSLSIPRQAVRDAVFATSGYEGITGTITCGELGDCATDVTIGVFLAPGWPVEGGTPEAAPVYSDTKTLAEVS
jgi:branched-chain amino acid transport system substrate-binding protein